MRPFANFLARTEEKFASAKLKQSSGHIALEAQTLVRSSAAVATFCTDACGVP